jgi:hypothetical protein
MGKLHSCQRPIKKWVVKQSHATDETIANKTRELEIMQVGEGPLNLQAKRNFKDEIHVLLEQQDLKWRQRAKEVWLQKGD